MKSCGHSLSPPDERILHRLRQTEGNVDKVTETPQPNAITTDLEVASSRDRLQDNPILRLVAVLVAISLGEYGIMVFLEHFAPSIAPHERLFDALTIGVLAFPVLVFLVIRPLQQQIAKRARTEKALRETIEALDKASAEVRYLRGLLPICASCKRIRDDGGAWTQIEQYIAANSEASFTHSICPDCAQALYPRHDRHREPQKSDGSHP